jgi:hypothetical protein
MDRRQFLRDLSLTALLGAAVTVLPAIPARAGELDEYLELSYEDGWSQITEHATELTDANVDDVLGYDGLVVIISTPECLTDKGEEQIRNYHAQTLELIERYNGTLDNRDMVPIKFAHFNSCDTNVSNPKTVQRISANGTDTIFWYNGHEFTRKEGAPVTTQDAEANLTFFDFLFRKNFTQFDGNILYLVNPDGEIYSTPAKL